jgi:hypothetical protein
LAFRVAGKALYQTVQPSPGLEHVQPPQGTDELLARPAVDPLGVQQMEITPGAPILVATDLEPGEHLIIILPHITKAVKGP